MKYVLTKPYTFEGETVEEIEFNLEEMTGETISRAKRKFATSGEFSMGLVTTDLDYCAYVVAELLGKPIEFMTQMAARDYCRIGMIVSAFLSV